jgi:dTDP-4-dehydrorhamnose reductase
MEIDMIHVIGASGMVGSELISRGCERFDCDVTSTSSIAAWMNAENPSTLIYCAGHTNVDWCEKNYKEALKVNTIGVSNIVDVFRGRLVYISTDYVFDGKKFLGSGYHEDSRVSPVNVYGQTKLSG